MEYADIVNLSLVIGLGAGFLFGILTMALIPSSDNTRPPRRGSVRGHDRTSSRV